MDKTKLFLLTQLDQVSIIIDEIIQIQLDISEYEEITKNIVELKHDYFPVRTVLLRDTLNRRLNNVGAIPSHMTMYKVVRISGDLFKFSFCLESDTKLCHPYLCLYLSFEDLILLSLGEEVPLREETYNYETPLRVAERLGYLNLFNPATSSVLMGYIMNKNIPFYNPLDDKCIYIHPENISYSVPCNPLKNCLLEDHVNDFFLSNKY